MDVTWMPKQECDKEPFVGFVQLYSDKYVIPLKRTGVTPYHVHIHLMKFSYDAWKKQISNKQTLPIYLLVGVDHEEDVWRMPEVDQSNTSFACAVKMTVVHKALQDILNPLRDVTATRF